MERDSASPGLLGTIHHMVDTVLKLAQNRLELFVTELQEEKFRAIKMLVMVAAGILFGVLAVLMFTLTCIFIFPEHKLGLAIFFTVLYGLLTLGLFLYVRNQLNGGRTPFAGTIEELKKDREWIRPRN